MYYESIEREYESLHKALGYGAAGKGKVKEIDNTKTSNVGLILQGYTTTITALDDEGVKHTVHYSPSTDRYACTHHSGERCDENRDEPHRKHHGDDRRHRRWR